MNKKIPYEKIIQKLDNREHNILIDFNREMTMIEDIIEESFHLDKIICKKIESNIKNKTQEILDDPKGMILLLFMRNNHYILASYKLALNGLNNPSNVILKSIFETILQMYMLYLTDEEANLFFKNAVGEQLTIEEENKIKNKFDYFRPKFIRKLLYTGDKLKKANEFYSVVSLFAHPSIKHSAGDFWYRKDDTKDTLSVIMYLGIANIIAINEIYIDLIDARTAKELQNLIIRILIEIGSLASLIPNKSKFKNKIK